MSESIFHLFCQNKIITFIILEIIDYLMITTIV